jgi:hypothetical protein
MNFTPSSFLVNSRPNDCRDYSAKYYALSKTSAVGGEWTAQWLNPLTLTYCTAAIQSAASPRYITAVQNTVTAISGDTANVTITDEGYNTNYVCPANMNLCVGQKYQIVVPNFQIAIVSYFDTGSCSFVCQADSGNNWINGTYYIDAVSGSVITGKGGITITPSGASYTTTCSGC